jgi:hypothetical protein
MAPSCTKHTKALVHEQTLENRAEQPGAHSQNNYHSEQVTKGAGLSRLARAQIATTASVKQASKRAKNSINI